MKKAWGRERASHSNSRNKENILEGGQRINKGKPRGAKDKQGEARIPQRGMGALAGHHLEGGVEVVDERGAVGDGEGRDNVGPDPVQLHHEGAQRVAVGRDLRERERGRMKWQWVDPQR